MKKQYKALMLDLDGTTIPNDPNGMPSQKVIRAINAASKKIHVGAVTGRPYFFTKHVTTSLSLSGPSIFGGGSKIIDILTEKVLWEASLLESDRIIVHNLLTNLNADFLIVGDHAEWRNVDSETAYQEKTFQLDAKDLSKEKAEKILTTLSASQTINAHKIIGWKKGTYWVQITNAEASKQHGILKVSEMLGIETHEIIGVGDGYNDFPLLMACGLKIAMGNAVPELKAIADYIAPTVEEDGVADVIEKFIL